MNRALQLVLTCALVLSACGDDDRPTTFVDVGRDSGVRDSATDDDAGDDGLDGGTPDAAAPTVLRSECEAVDPFAFGNEDLPADERPSGLSLPLDFTVTRAVGTWDKGDCTDPKFIVTLSEGRCPTGRGQSLTFELSANALIAGVIHPGDNILSANPEDTGIAVRYEHTSDPAGSFGTCEGVTGQVSFRNPPELDLRERLIGTFQMELSHCADATLPPQRLVGGFSVVVRREITDVCP